MNGDAGRGSPCRRSGPRPPGQAAVGSSPHPLPAPHLLLDLPILGDHPVGGGSGGPRPRGQQRAQAQGPAGEDPRSTKPAPPGRSCRRHLPQSRPARTTRNRNRRRRHFGRGMAERAVPPAAGRCRLSGGTAAGRGPGAAPVSSPANRVAPGRYLRRRQEPTGRSCAPAPPCGGSRGSRKAKEAGWRRHRPRREPRPGTGLRLAAPPIDCSAHI